MRMCEKYQYYEQKEKLVRVKGIGDSVQNKRKKLAENFSDTSNFQIGLFILKSYYLCSITSIKTEKSIFNSKIHSEMSVWSVNCRKVTFISGLNSKQHQYN